MNADKTWKDWGKLLFILPLLAVLVVIGIPGVLLWLFGSFLLRLLTLFLVWTVWSPRGISMLIIYSNSPHWQNYFEKGLLPLVGRQAKVLNWSERKTWQFSLRSVVFALLKGNVGHENPLILWLTPFRWPKRLCFYRPFHDARHGKTKPLQKLEQELSVLIDQQISLEHLYPRQSA